MGNVADNSPKLFFRTIWGKNKEVYFSDINGTSKEYLIRMAGNDEKQIALIESIFNNKEINQNGDNLLDNNELQNLFGMISNISSRRIHIIAINLT